MRNEQKVCNICKKRFITDDNDKKYHKVRDQCHYTGKCRGAAHDICNLRYKTPKEIFAVFQNGLTYDYYFIIKELAEEFNGQFKRLGENTEKYITFSVPIKEELDNGKSITYKIKLTDSFRFMSSSLSSLVGNLAADEIKKIFSYEYENCNNKLDCLRFKDNNMVFKCFQCNSWYKKQFEGDLINKFKNTYELYNKDISKFILVLRKGISPYEYMDSWEKFDETSFPNKEAFYSSLNTENIADID